MPEEVELTLTQNSVCTYPDFPNRFTAFSSISPKAVPVEIGRRTPRENDGNHGIRALLERTERLNTGFRSTLSDGLWAIETIPSIPASQSEMVQTAHNELHAGLHNRRPSLNRNCWLVNDTIQLLRLVEGPDRECYPQSGDYSLCRNYRGRTRCVH
ncbi:hypothetical protein K435DRAFT_971761 [Dendrothele bispora CBS 962.96]|uniref:Uncharacterized protein n=1 Tax=Dendrothele bispora (strain CBS 962.96) TaxID=1314807 RepID=A0A4V4HCD6_DENBC|nr:hypothetical protein K435DRAFT_971761 [Dendrothele bispora CBS 962.96]